MGYLLGVRRVAGVLLIASLSACSSGGGEGDETRSTHTSVSTNAIEFAVDAPDAAKPPAQTVTATFGDDVAHLAIIHNGAGIANVTSEVSGRTAAINIDPTAPTDLGSGIFPGSVAITGYFCADAACTSLAAGNTQTITVRYQISPVIQTVMPYVGTASVADTAIIRGVGFRSFATQGVRVGATAATEFSINSDTELRVSYPGLAAGSYEIQIDIPEHEGDLQSSARLVIVDPTNYSAQALAYPTTGSVLEVVYDAERSAILVATDAGGGTVHRYAFAEGAWQTPSSAVVSELRDITLSTQGERLLTLTQRSLILADPTTLAAETTIAAEGLDSGVTLKNIAITNEDRAFVTTGQSTSGATPVYLYSGRQATLIETSQTLNNATPTPAGQGSSIVFIQGHSTLTSAPPVFLFATGAAQFQPLGVSLNQNAIAPVVDKAGRRAILNGTRVHGTTETESFALLGTLPATTVALAVNKAGSRAYTYDSAAAGILVFDISADRDEAAYAALGAAVPLAGDPGASPKMTISPDDKTLFIAGSARLVIQPAPAL